MFLFLFSFFNAQSQNSPRRSKSIKHKNGESASKVAALCGAQPCERSVVSLAGDFGSSVGSDVYKVTEIPSQQSKRARARALNPPCVCFQYNYNSGISYETLGPDEVRSLLTTVSRRAGAAVWAGPGRARPGGPGHYAPLPPLTSSLSLQQCGVISEHTKKMCTRYVWGGRGR